MQFASAVANRFDRARMINYVPAQRALSASSKVTIKFSSKAGDCSPKIPFVYCPPTSAYRIDLSAHAVLYRLILQAFDLQTTFFLEGEELANPPIKAMSCTKL